METLQREKVHILPPVPSLMPLWALSARLLYIIVPPVEKNRIGTFLNSVPFLSTNTSSNLQQPPHDRVEE